MFDSRYINIIKFNRDFDYKNLNFYEIIRAINNIVYELNLSKLMKKMFSIFHFWLLHLKNNNSFSKQKNHESNFIAIDVENNELWKIEKILKFKINMKMIDFEFQQSNVKECFYYYVKWINWQQINQRFEWYKYIWIKIASYLIVDYHYKYSNKIESHYIFVRSNNWILSMIVIATSKTSI